MSINSLIGRENLENKKIKYINIYIKLFLEKNKRIVEKTCD